MVIPGVKKLRRFCLQHTRAGKVDRLEALTESLTQNTALVKKKYGELGIVEEEVTVTLAKLKTETFAGEKREISKLLLLPEEEREKFKNALVTIRDKGIAELEPISAMAQRIKAHMLITLNKAQIQKAILLAKSRLAGNAHLQLKTLKTIENETSNINLELKDLLEELDKLNEGAIEKFSSFKREVKTMTTKGDENIIDDIITRLDKLPADQNPQGKKKKQTKEKEKIK